MRRQGSQARREPRCVVSLAHVPERESLIRSVRAKTLVSPAGAGLGFRGAARLLPSTRVAVAPTRSLCGDALGSPHSHLGQTQVRAFT